MYVSCACSVKEFQFKDIFPMTAEGYEKHEQ
jgi:hypothetical protein